MNRKPLTGRSGTGSPARPRLVELSLAVTVLLLLNSSCVDFLNRAGAPLRVTTSDLTVLNSNDESFAVVGTCLATGGEVVLSFVGEEVVTSCEAGGTFSASLDLSDQPDGAITLTVSQGNVSETVTLTVDAEVCRATAGSGLVASGSTLTICDAGHWGDIAALLGAGDQNIELRDNIDFGGATVAPLGVLNANDTFDGNGRTLSNIVLSNGGGNTSLIGTVGSLGANTITVEDFTLDGVTADGEDRFGAVIHSVFLDSTDSVTIRDIVVNDLTVTNPASPGEAQGGVLGFVQNTSATATLDISNVSISNSTLDTETTTAGVGGLAGIVEGLFGGGVAISEVTVESVDVTGAGMTGGIIGATGGLVTVSNALVRGGSVNVSSAGCSPCRNVGGAFGAVFDDFFVTDTIVDGVTIDLSTGEVEKVGGFAGLVSDDSTVTRSSSNADVVVPTSTTYSSMVGGFVGELAANATISLSSARGNVVGDEFVGGFVGVHLCTADGDITDSYARGDVEARVDRVGGFAGGSPGCGSTAVYERLYAFGTTTSGGADNFAFADSGDVTQTNVFFNSTVSTGSAEDATGIAQVNMTDLSNFTGFLPSVWATSGTLGPYPYLVWEE